MTPKDAAPRPVQPTSSQAAKNASPNGDGRPPLDEAIGDTTRRVLQKGGQAALTATVKARQATKKAAEVASQTVRKVLLTKWDLAAIAWELVALFFLIPLYLGPTADGLKLTLPTMGRRMYKHHIIGRVFDTSWGYRLTTADLFALGILLMAAILWFFVLRDRILRSGNNLDERVANTSQFMGIIRTLAWAILGADALLFFVGIMGSRGWDLWGMVCALAGTSLYIGSLVFVSLIAVWISYQKKRSKA